MILECSVRLLIVRQSYHPSGKVAGVAPSDGFTTCTGTGTPAKAADPTLCLVASQIWRSTRRKQQLLYLFQLEERTAKRAVPWLFA